VKKLHFIKLSSDKAPLHH